MLPTMYHGAGRHRARVAALRLRVRVRAGSSSRPPGAAGHPRRAPRQCPLAGSRAELSPLACPWVQVPALPLLLRSDQDRVQQPMCAWGGCRGAGAAGLALESGAAAGIQAALNLGVPAAL